jgi:streptomycin 3"-adenylyltransferase
MGGFNPQSSDIDYLAIISTLLSLEERKELSTEFLKVFQDRDGKELIEMSIVGRRFVGKDFRYPTPFEFHMGTKEQVRTQASPQTKEMADPDLASYLRVIYERGLCIYGEDIESVFAPIDKKYYWLSVQNDLKDVPEGIHKDPVYHILNLCRTFYALKDGKIYSKKEGGEMYLADNAMSGSKELVRSALEEYSSGRKSTHAKVDLDMFASMMLSTIKPTLAEGVVN